MLKDFQKWHKKKTEVYFSFKLRGGDSTVILSQIRLIDAKRLKYKMGDVGESDFAILKTKIRQLLA